MSKIQDEKWNSRVGVIFAVSGSAVGLGNFLRFPGLVAEYGGGAFMIAYIISFLLIGLPICWAEWTMGRQGGQNGFNSSPGIFSSITNHKRFKYLGVIALIIPIGIYFYYLIIESWCLAYATNYLLGNMRFSNTVEAVSFFHNLVGVFENGSALNLDLEHLAIFVIIALAINFYFVSKGISKGIERFCVMAMPLLLLIALIILVRVITLGTPDPAQPNNSIASGLGYMWNPSKTIVEVRDSLNAPWKFHDQILKNEKLTLIEKYLNIIGMNKFIKHYPSELSGGQITRIACIRTILSFPKVILMDEPFSSLDKSTLNSFRNFVLKEIKSLFIPCIIVTHNKFDANFSNNCPIILK